MPSGKYPRKPMSKKTKIKIGQKRRMAFKRNPNISFFKKGHNGFFKELPPEKQPNWKGGIAKDGRGYVKIYTPKHPFANTCYVLEHRLVVEKIIERCLVPEEETHHINEIKDDNRPENLMVFNDNVSHRRFHLNLPIQPSDIIFDGRAIK